MNTTKNESGFAGLTARLADHVAHVANSPLTAEDVEAVRRLFLDGFVVSLWGSTRPAAKQIAEWSRRFAGTGNSVVLGGDWTTEASTAALVHGTAGHSYELDDTHDVTTSHPGCVIIPAALAVAAETNASQSELFRAVAAGYEAMALIGTTAGGLETVHRGFHPTSVFGSFGAAAAVLSLRAYRNKQPVDPGVLVTAWGHALSQASGSMQFSVEPTGGEVKRVHAGLGARNGVLAADFAMLPDVTAPQLSVEGTYGAAASFGGPLRDVTPDEKLQIHVISFKPYSCCRLFHSTIDALREVTDDFSASTDGIEEVLVTGPQLIADQHMTKAESTMTAQYSCPYIVGATLAYGPTRYDAYGEAFLDDERILRIAGKVRFEVDPDLEEKYYPQHFATGVRMRFTDGSTRSATVVDSVGTAQHPMTKEQIIAKGDGLASQGNFPTGDELAAVIWDDANGGVELAKALVSR
ncbi:MAG: MmgE/PrpD family protein [Rhodococcus sp. (in: high G+C Gram-positive bacteria)]|nr:MAG: MmgE/PrpD family protein [Rhodococcus sp. (in: high G+C Gram-positive bacteria)]